MSGRLENAMINRNGGLVIAGCATHAVISHEELLVRLEDRALVILNVMPSEIFVTGHIPSSINLSVSEIEAQARRWISQSRSGNRRLLRRPDVTARWM